MSQDQLVGLLPLVLIFAAFWFLLIRPQRKRQQELSRLQGSVEPGNAVMLGSGIYGTVRAVADDTVDLEVAPGTTVKVARQAVVRVVEPTQATGDPQTRPAESPHTTDEQ